MKFEARRYDTLEPVSIRLEGERITSVDPSIDPSRGTAKSLPIVAPGFFDLQINGYAGIWFGQPGITADDVLKTLNAHYAFGVTHMFPTLITNSKENLVNGFRAIREACEREAWADRLVAGCHLEGPYLSGEDGPRGAHPREHIRPADWTEFEEFQQTSGGRIKLVTIAPETEGAIEFIRRAVSEGIVCSIGHTAAEPQDIRNAVEAGAKMSTHLGNGSHGTIRRHPNYIWEQLAEDRLAACLITDGYHLPDSVIKCMVRAKGVENCLLTCDASGLAGCPPGVYPEDGHAVEVLEDGRIVVAGQREYLAGSGASTDLCVGRAAQFPEIGLKQACEMAGNRVRQMFHVTPVLLKTGSIADLTLFEQTANTGIIRIVGTIVAGKIRYGESA